MIWNTFGLKSGVQISDLVESSFDYKLPTTDATYRQMCLNYVVDTIDEYCNDHRRQVDARDNLNILQRTFATVWCLTGKYLGNYLVILYMATKLMYISSKKKVEDLFKCHKSPTTAISQGEKTFPI